MTTTNLSHPSYTGNRVEVALEVTGAANEWTPTTIEEKAAFYGELAIWSEIPWMPLSLLCLSPVSGRKYRIDFDAITGRTTCNCQRGMSKRPCWHAESFRSLMLAPLYAKYRASLASGPVQHSGDFDEDVRLSAAYRCAAPAPKQIQEVSDAR